MQYLTHWRMTLARDYWTPTGELTLARIANRTGYASPNAFAAAFPPTPRTASRPLAARRADQTA
jgi:transcriptional regulator GlxA family with amidase domain